MCNDLEPDWIGLVEGWRKPRNPDIVEFPDGAPTVGQLIDFLSTVDRDAPVTVLMGDDDEHPIMSVTNEYTCVAIRVCQ